MGRQLPGRAGEAWDLGVGCARAKEGCTLQPPRRAAPFAASGMEGSLLGGRDARDAACVRCGRVCSARRLTLLRELPALRPPPAGLHCCNAHLRVCAHVTPQLTKGLSTEHLNTGSAAASASRPGAAPKCSRLNEEQAITARYYVGQVHTRAGAHRAALGGSALHHALQLDSPACTHTNLCPARRSCPWMRSAFEMRGPRCVWGRARSAAHTCAHWRSCSCLLEPAGQNKVHCAIHTC
jgi:hypothetical protein